MNDAVYLVIGFVTGAVLVAGVFLTSSGDLPKDNEIGYYTTEVQHSKDGDWRVKVWHQLNIVDKQ